MHERLPACTTLVLTGLSRPGSSCGRWRSTSAALSKDDPATAGCQSTQNQTCVNGACVEAFAVGVCSACSGERVIDPELMSAAIDTGSTLLSSREADVLRAAGTNISTEEIATRLSLSPATVRNYLSKCSQQGCVGATAWMLFAAQTTRAG